MSKVVCIHTVTGDIIAELVKVGESSGDLYVKFPTRLAVQMDMSTGQPTPPQFIPVCILNPDPDMEIKIHKNSIVLYYTVDENVQELYNKVKEEYSIQYKASKSDLIIAKGEQDVKNVEGKLKLIKTK